MSAPKPTAVRSLRLRVASPCTEDWEGMSGNHLVRYCGKCEKNVYNLSELTTGEATRLVEQMEGRMCATFYARTDGSVLTADCPVGARKVRRKRQVIVAAFGAVAGLFGWLARPAPAHVVGDLAEPRPMGAVARAPEPPVAKPPCELGPRSEPKPRLTGEVAPEPRRLMGGVSRPKPRPEKLMGKIAVRPERLTGDLATD